MNILAVGNSYTLDSFYYSAQIAESLGIEDYNFATLYSAGRTIEAHYNCAVSEKVDENKASTYYENYKEYSSDGSITTKTKVSTREILDLREWDVIVFQGSPNGAAQSWGFTKFDKLIDWIRSVEGSHIRFMWQMSWSYAEIDDVELSGSYYTVSAENGGDGKFIYNNNILAGLDKIELSGNTDSWSYLFDNGTYSQSKMDNLIFDNTRSNLVDGQYSNDIGLNGIIPIGYAIKTARENSAVEWYIDNIDSQSVMGSTGTYQLTRDGYHLSVGSGRYIAGLSLVKAISGADITNISYMPEGMTDAQREAAINSVNTAFAFRDNGLAE